MNNWRYRFILALGLLFALGGSFIFAEQLFLQAKKRVATTLIADAYAEYLRDGAAHPPWPWADFHPIAKLESLAKDGSAEKGLIVLSGASGSSLAFGVGHADGAALPNRPGNCVLAGHQTVEFSFLEDVQVGDIFRLSTSNSTSQRYEVIQIEVVGSRDLRVVADHGFDELTFITCYPFGGLRKVTQRFVVHCRPIAGARVVA